jgi:hypothetical protein
MAPRGGGALRLVLNSYATSVPESELQPKIVGIAPSHSELRPRSSLVTARTDFPLGHLRPSDRELRLFIQRRTGLFGREIRKDNKKARRQAHGVRHPNRGTGRHEKAWGGPTNEAPHA